MENFDELVIPKFGGINLDTRVHALGPDETDDLLNVWGNGTYFRKRPGMRYLGQFSTDTNGPIYDIIRSALYNSSGTVNKLCHDVIHVVSFSNTPYYTSKHAYWKIGAGAKAGGTNINYGYDNGKAPRMINCGDRVFVTTSPYATEYNKIQPTGTTQEYSITSGGGPTHRHSFGAWHKQHLFLGGMGDPDRAHDVVFSDYNLPATWPGANTFSLNPTGAINSVTGLYSDGELLYIGKVNQISALSGSTVADFRVETITTAHGFVGCRSMCSLGEFSIGWDIDGNGLTYSGGATSGNEQFIVRGILSVSGMRVEQIGDKVSPLFDSYPSSAKFFPKAEYNRQDGYALMIPNPDGVSGSADAVVYERGAGAWFRWRFDSSSGGCARVLPSCLAYGPGADSTKKQRMYVGTHSGSLCWLDDTLPHDEAKDGSTLDSTNNIESYWTSSWITRKSFEHFKSPEYVFIQGKPNTGGDNPTLWMKGDYATQWTQIGTFPLEEEGHNTPVSSRVKMSKSVKLKISFANNSYGGEVRRVVLAQKPMGMH